MLNFLLPVKLSVALIDRICRASHRHGQRQGAYPPPGTHGHSAQINLHVTALPMVHLGECCLLVGQSADATDTVDRALALAVHRGEAGNPGMGVAIAWGDSTDAPRRAGGVW